MCDICHSARCLPGCPNAPDPKPLYECCECGDGIYPGDKYLEADRHYYCKDCLDDMAAETLLSIVGVEMETAEEPGEGC